MSETIRDRKHARAWQLTHDPRAPKLGELAPDFQLRDATGEHNVQLSEFRGREPVALIFGSFT